MAEFPFCRWRARGPKRLRMRYLLLTAAEAPRARANDGEDHAREYRVVQAVPDRRQDPARPRPPASGVRRRDRDLQGRRETDDRHSAIGARDREDRKSVV